MKSANKTPLHASVLTNLRHDKLLKVGLMLFMMMATPVSASPDSNDYDVAIDPVSLSGGPPVARTQYRSGDSVGLKITETNLSADTRNVPLGEDYVRPRLLKDGVRVPYRKTVAERIAKLDQGSPFRYGGVMYLRPLQPQSDVIDLSYWYESLPPGSYQVAVERLFSERQRENSNTAFFEVLPSIDVPAADITTRVIKLQMDGEEIKANYRVFLAAQGKEFEAAVNKDGFVVPAELRDSETIGVRVVIGTENLDFSKVHISKFDNEWIIGIDRKPFSEEFADGTDMTKVKLIYYILFQSKRGLDTQLISVIREREK